MRMGVSRSFDAVGTGFAQAAEENKARKSTLQIGLLDPIALTVRSMTTSVLPTVHMASESIYTEPREYWQAWVVGLIFIGFLVANWWIPRFFCRAICPLGALLGIFSRFSLWRIDRDPVRCTDCDLCIKNCEGASDPHKDLRKSECFVCLNCIEDCPHDALTFRFLPRKASEVTYPEVGRRQLMLAGMFGLFFFPMARLSGGVRKNFSRAVIRPPGSVAEDEFLRRCIKCDQCIRVCPTNVLQPAMFEAGLEGLWTPIMISKMGWCELNCTLCSQVCPTGAIREISIAEKLGVGPFEAKGPIKTGTAFYNQGRCLPWAMDTSCVVCEEVCPVSPKAIFTRNVEVTDRWGSTLQLKRPVHRPRAMHRLRDLRARVPRQGRPGRLRHGHRRDAGQVAVAAAVARGRERAGPGVGLTRLRARSPCVAHSAATPPRPGNRVRPAAVTALDAGASSAPHRSRGRGCRWSSISTSRWPDR